MPVYGLPCDDDAIVKGAEVVAEQKAGDDEKKSGPVAKRGEEKMAVGRFKEGFRDYPSEDDPPRSADLSANGV